MRILADENVPAAVVTALQERGDDIVWIRTVAPGIDDQEVFRRARDESRVILTFDKEFGELAFHARLPAPSGVILFRLTVASPQAMAAIAVAALGSRTDWEGQFAVVEENRIRLMPLP